MRAGAGKGVTAALDQAVDRLDRLDRRGRMLPVPVTNLLATADIKTRGAQISFQVASLEGVESFVLMRNLSQDIGSAQIVAIWPRSSLLSTPQKFPLTVSHSDSDQAIAGRKAYYWLKAIPASTKTALNVFVSGPQIFDASLMPPSSKIAADYAVSGSYTATTQQLTATTGGAPNQATISIAGFQVKYPFGLVSYNSGTITPLLDNTGYYVYCNDPTMKGGAQTYFATTQNPALTDHPETIFLGSVTTPVFGGGPKGGGGGGGGPCFDPETLILTKRGNVEIAAIMPLADEVMTRVGWRKVTTVFSHDYDGLLHEMPDGALVTPDHRIRRGPEWVRAAELFSRVVSYQGMVYNLGIEGESDEEHCYQLSNGYMAHNSNKVVQP